MKQKTANRSPARRTWAANLFLIVLVVGAGYVTWLALGAPGLPRVTPDPTGPPPTPKPTRTLRPTRTPRPTQTPKSIATPALTAVTARKKVGIVAGHWQNDSGAICPDGLEEVSINLDVASRVVAILQYEGYEAELLAEFDDRLPRYRADAFLSIHTDSCEIPEASGFKVARLAASSIPEIEDRLVECLIREYGEATGLAFHKDSITFDMTGYHAFKEIDPQTPGAIIELGFMAADRDLLINHSYEVAQGIARGIVCFLEE
ncbi:MAG: N-acetylmuramoyl-L-alanine amidase [Anaerolineae bacterium]|nr:N-acetylmuramoyl-L-alanine amidase [Anaerolineae bacterium]